MRLRYIERSALRASLEAAEEVGMIHSGQYGRFHWLVASFFQLSLIESAIRFHPNLRLCITSCDSGPIRPNPEEQAVGWVSQGDVMVSPPLAEGIDIPLDQYDEWYFLGEPPRPEWRPEVFVNYGGFTLLPPEEVYKTYDPTWDRHGLDYLAPMQERFWAQVEQVDPISYIAMGDQDVVVSKRLELIEHLRAGS